MAAGKVVDRWVEADVGKYGQNITTSWKGAKLLADFGKD